LRKSKSIACPSRSWLAAVRGLLAGDG